MTNSKTNCFVTTKTRVSFPIKLLVVIKSVFLLQPMGDDGKWFLNQTDPTKPYYDWKYGTKGEWSQGEPWCEKPEQPDDVNTETGDIRSHCKQI